MESAIMLSFLQNVQECDATIAWLCTNADLIKTKIHFICCSKWGNEKFITFRMDAYGATHQSSI